MTFVLLLPTVLSLLLLAAHFLRSANLAMVSTCLLFLVLLFIKRSWLARTMQVVLILAALEWLFTACIIAQQRQEEGRPWLRAAVIVISVAGLNLVSAMLFQTRRLARRYKINGCPVPWFSTASA